MTKKELKNLAKQIAECERVIQTSEDKDERRQAEERIMKITRTVRNFEDLSKIDELAMKILEKN